MSSESVCDAVPQVGKKVLIKLYSEFDLPFSEVLPELNKPDKDTLSPPSVPVRLVIYHTNKPSFQQLDIQNRNHT